MTKIENVSCTIGRRAKTLQRTRHLGTNVLWRPKKTGGIQIALQGATIPHPTARLPKMRGPVQSDGISPGCSNRLKPLTATLYKNDDRRGGSVRLAVTPTNLNTANPDLINDGLEMPL